MKGRRCMCIRLLLWSLVVLLTVPSGAVVVQSQETNGQVIFRQEELDQMLAPIALYPDELLVQILMAATYPLEVVQAGRWIEANQNLRGDQLAITLEQQNWDPSVKSLISFPSVLQMMNERLDWTQMLGDAFLAQEGQVMDTVQQLRQRAQAQGYLRTTSEQTVIMDPQQGIIIEPASPQVVYVPVYDPMVVYGPWWWPSYRPYYYHPRGVAIRGDIVGFGIGVTIGVAWGYAWGAFNWHRHDVGINVTRNQRFNTHIDRNRYASRVSTGGGPGTWRHDPGHRLGVAYRSPSDAQRYGRGPLPGSQTRRDFRGFDRGGTGTAVHGATGPDMQQRRVTAGPTQSKLQAPSQTAGSMQQKLRPIPPPQSKVESPRQPAGPIQQPRIPPAVSKPEPAKPPVSRTLAGVQGTQGPTVFGGTESASKVRQFSTRGHESLVSTPPRAQTPNKAAAPHGESTGGAPRGNFNRGASPGGR
jgi:hypothetical protein